MNPVFINRKLVGWRLFIAAFLTLLLVGTVAVEAQSIAQEQGKTVKNQATMISVPYVTLRNRTESSEPANYYGVTRGPLSAGICNVSFAPIWGLDQIARSVPFYIPDEGVELTDIEEISLDSLYSEIEQFPLNYDSNIVIYIHGYNIDFEKSCRRSALLQRALGLHDRLLLFSWPAAGNMLKYTWDESNLVWSVPQIAHFIDEVVKRAGNHKVDLVAHSLGARGAVQALARLSYNKPAAAIINELVLIAPDIDAEIFRQDFAVIEGSVNRVTIYVSENDGALKLSQEVHGYSRLGEAGDDLAVLEGVETIDISNINSRRISGHLYHLFSPEVIADLTQLLHDGDSASMRPSLRELSHNGLPYWQMKATE